MKNICLILLKPHALVTDTQESLLGLLEEYKIEILYEKVVEVTRENLLQSQPVLTSSIVDRDELEAVVGFSVGRSKIFLVSGDNDLFQNCSEIKWKIRDKYSPSPEKYIKGKIRPFFIHCSDGPVETERDVLSFIPEKLNFVEMVNKLLPSATVDLSRK